LAVEIKTGIRMAKHNAASLDYCFLNSKNGYTQVSGKLLSFPFVQLA